MQKKTNKPLYGVQAKLQENKPIIPEFLTNTITATPPQIGKKLPLVNMDNVLAAKEFVDDNHK